MRSALRTEIGRKGFAQAILRFGVEWLPAPADPATIYEPAPVRRGLALASRT
jgi:hypothetical protein